MSLEYTVRDRLAVRLEARCPHCGAGDAGFSHIFCAIDLAKKVRELEAALAEARKP